MDYLILNEASIPYPDRTTADSEFPGFLNIVDSALSNGFAAVLMSGENGTSWFEIPLSERYVVREWLDHQEREYQRLIRSLLTKTKVPQIPAEEVVAADRFALSGFWLLDERNIAVPSLGAAYLLSQMALGFASHSRWAPDLVALWHEELTETGEQSASISAKHCLTLGQWQTFLGLILAERQESLRKGSELWDTRETLFPNLVFCGDTPKQIRKLSCSITVYNQFFQALTQLNDYCTDGASFALQSIKEVTNLTITDESNSVKDNPRLSGLRTFKVKEERRFFGYHVKNFSGAFRLHFLPEREDGKIYIGYFGKHLPTT